LTLGPYWIEAFRYHRWANTHLLGVLSGFGDEQLQLTAPGTYGTIAATLQHMFSAEQRYVARLGGAKAELTEDVGFPGLERIALYADRSADELLALADRFEAGTEMTAHFRDGTYRFDPGVVLLQALHHGNDHRTHICSILGAHSIECGEMDLWAYGEATGALVKVSA
jgi:uncharacterized damage-inducible protein DinB